MAEYKDQCGGGKLAKAVRAAYKEDLVDYSMEPLALVDKAGNPVGKIKDGDAVIFCCRRGEREIELTDAFTDPEFPHFAREAMDLDFVILTMYHEKYKDLPIAFAPSKVEQTLGEIIGKAGLRQLHLAESEKYAHVTYFFNGGNNQPCPGEDDVRVPSPKGVPFDTVPELSLPTVAEEVKKGLNDGYDFIVANFANGDVIGHTANTEAKVKCAEAVDRYLGEVVEHARKKGYIIAITADHGNIEVAYNKEGKPHVAHTTNLVPFVMIDPSAGAPVGLKNGSLGNIAPTVLEVLGLEKPAAMTGKSLVAGYNFDKGQKMLLIILDGWGLGAEDDSNPVFTAQTPYWDRLLATYPPAKLKASGEAVGLQEGKAGNSEAGHINIGAGRVVMQDDVRLDAAMKDGSFQKNQVFLSTIERARERGSTLHLLALLTKKSSHGSVDYPLALLNMAKEKGLGDVKVHIIFDGRSTEPGSAPALLEELDATLAEIGVGQIVDGIGRGIALDRDGNYTKIQKAYDCFVKGEGRQYK